MKHVQENLEQYKDFKFFSILEEKEEQKKKEDKGNDGNDDAKQAAEANKDCQSIFKKIGDNFNRFMNYAGDQMGEYKKFWDMQSKANMFNKPLYAMFNDGNQEKYIPKFYVTLKPIKNEKGGLIGTSTLIVVELSDAYRKKVYMVNEEDKQPDANELGYKEIFSTVCSAENVNQFNKFFTEMGKQLTAKKKYYIEHVENKKKEAELKVKRESLNKFLKESRKSKR